jgi:hypothetical protein
VLPGARLAEERVERIRRYPHRLVAIIGL